MGTFISAIASGGVGISFAYSELGGFGLSTVHKFRTKCYFALDIFLVKTFCFALLMFWGFFIVKDLISDNL